MKHLYDYYTIEPVSESEKLEQLERSISVSFFALFDMVNRLKQIRHEKLYLATHADFDDYLEERWGMCRKSFRVQCNVLGVADDLLEAKVPVEAFSSLPILMEYYNLDKRQRWDLAKRVLSGGAGRIDKAFTHLCKQELFPDKCEEPRP